MTANRFNLIDEQWIPVLCAGRVSLKQIFEDTGDDPKLKRLGGDPLSKIAIFKLLLAIAQTAATPTNAEEWRNLEVQGLSARVLAYLSKWHDSFYLFGDKPFLQYPKVKLESDRIHKNEKKFAPLKQAALLPHIATGNTTVLTQMQNAYELSDAERAVLLVFQMSMCLGGKKPDKRISFTPGYQKKSAPSGPGLGSTGFLHSFLTGSSILESVYFNLLTEQDISGIRTFEKGLGCPPWEQMPAGEDDEIAKALKASYMGRLVPMARFILLHDGEIYITEGIKHPDYKDKVWDPSITEKKEEAKPTKKNKAKVKTKKTFLLTADPAKRPWRDLPAILSFKDTGSQVAGCLQLKFGLDKIFGPNGAEKNFGIWSGGVRTKNTSGEQKVNGKNDYVDSDIEFSNDIESRYYKTYCSEMTALEDLSLDLCDAVESYYGDFGIDDPKVYVTSASEDFWELCGKYSQDMLNAVFSGDEAKLQSLRNKFNSFALLVYDNHCSEETVRQIKSKFIHKPKIGWYLGNGRKK